LLGPVSEFSHPSPNKLWYYNALDPPYRSGIIDLSAVSKVWNTNFEVPALQPKRELSPMPTIAIGVLQTGHVEIQAKIYADLLPTPQVHTLSVNVTVETRETSATEIINSMNTTGVPEV
jgi:hypothetical protein